MQTGALASALEQEHREIDGGIESFIADPAGDPAHTELLTRSLDALRRHIYLEEQFLFPPLRTAGMTMPIFVMVREHGELWATMDDLTALLDGGADHQELLDTSRELLEGLNRHNSKEEPIIYPQADAALSSEAGAELGAFLRSGQLPEGWLPEGA